MPAHRNDAKANSMYDLYQSGYSLAQVAKAFSVTRQGVFKMFEKRGFAMRTIVPLPFVVWGDCKYTRRQNGYYAKTNGDREYLHRDVWMHANGEIPEYHDVHHKDGDKTNNQLSNLELMHVSDHGRHHSETNEGFKKTRFKKGHPSKYHPRKKSTVKHP